jgi:hypothetical protein
MKLLRRFFPEVILLYFLIFYSCSNKEMVVNDNKCSHRIQITRELIANSNLYSQILENPVFIQLDTCVDALYGDIGSITMHNDTIYIFDVWHTKSIYAYSLDGKLANKISRIGRGPSEYTYPIDFCVNASNGDVSVLDWATKKILTYDKLGNYLDDVRFTDHFTSFSIVNNTIYGLKENPTTPDEHLLKCYDLDGKPYLYGLQAKDMNYDGAINLTTGREFVELVDGVRFTVSEKNTVYSIKNDTISTFIRVEYSKHLLNEDGDIPNTLYAYSETNNYAFFKANINNLPYDIIYNLKTNEIFVFSLFTFDDITKLPVTLLGIWENKAIARVDFQSISYINELLFNGKIVDPIFVDFVSDYKADILVLYDLALP